MMLLGRPYTDENGWVDKELITDLPEEKKNACITWIKMNIYPRATKNPSITSYGLKHCLERDTGIYLTNNQFKDAMLECGYEPCDPNELNWHYRISNKSPAFKSMA